MKMIGWVWVIVLAMAAPLLAKDEHAAADPSLFAGTLAQSIAAVIVFLILLAVLSKFAWGPILKGLQDREKKIKDDLQRAEHAAREAAATLQEYENKLAEAQSETARMIEQGKADAQKIAAGIKQQAETDINQMRRRAEADIAAAKQQALNELYAQTADLATSVAGRILQREIAAGDHKKLIEESLKALGSRQG